MNTTKTILTVSFIAAVSIAPLSSAYAAPVPNVPAPSPVQKVVAHDNGTISIQKAADDLINKATMVNVYLFVDGKGTSYWTPRTTVANFLETNKVKLGSQDKISVDADSYVEDKLLIKIVRTFNGNVKNPVQDVAFKTMAIRTEINCEVDAKGVIPDAQVVTKGVKGIRTEVWNKHIVDGNTLSQKLVSNKVTANPINQIVAPCKNSAKAIQKANLEAEGRGADRAKELLKIKTQVQKDNTLGNNDEMNKLADELNSLDSTAPKMPTSSAKVPNKKDKESTYVADSSLSKKEQWMRAAGIDKSQWKYVDYIVKRESEWKPTAVNPSSGACSLVQALPCSKIGSDWRDPVTALKWQKNYVEERYGSYQKAYEFWTRNHWY